MINLRNDIFLFENILKDDFINKLILLRKNSNHFDRINLTGNNIALLYEFDKLWMELVEPVIMQEYLQIYDLANGIGINASEDTVKQIKEHCKTIWRDLFILNYNFENSKDCDKRVHWDFSGLTGVAALNSDYVGGELCFPRHDLCIKLNKGDLIIFPGGLTHPHFVKTTTEGYRNVLVGQSLTLIQDHKIEY
jgi:hypothetical protein